MVERGTVSSDIPDIVAGAAVQPAPARPRSIVHVDMDAFFVAVEVGDDPSLRGRPVVVGGAGRRGVVAAASYQARAFGVRSAMPSATARRLCPEAVFVAARHARYREVSAELHAILGEVTPAVEGVSLDEAFLDVTGALRRLGGARSIAAALRERIHGDLGLSCSVGVAPRKLTAKLASEAAKPTASSQGVHPGPGIVVVDPHEELAFLHAHPVEAMWGIGSATLARLQRRGVRTIGELARLPEAALVGMVGASLGRTLHARSWAASDEPVVVGRAPKSISHEETFAVDHRSRAVLDREVLRLADAVAGRLRRAGLAARTLQVKIRFADFRTITRSSTCRQPMDDARVLASVGRELLGSVDLAPGVRLLGVGVSRLSAGGCTQLCLDDTTGPGDRRARARSGGSKAMGHRRSTGGDDRVEQEPTFLPERGSGGADRARADAAVDELRRRFGDAAIGPASLVGRRRAPRR